MKILQCFGQVKETNINKWAQKEQDMNGNSSDSQWKQDRRTKYVAAEEQEESDPLVMKMIREPSAKAVLCYHKHQWVTATCGTLEPPSP